MTSRVSQPTWLPGLSWRPGSSRDTNRHFRGKVMHMHIAVIGGTGLIGAPVVKLLQAAGHDAVPLSPSTGVNLLTGEGLDTGLKGADVVVNLTNSPTFDDASP